MCECLSWPSGTVGGPGGYGYELLCLPFLTLTGDGGQSVNNTTDRHHNTQGLHRDDIEVIVIHFGIICYNLGVMFGLKSILLLCLFVHMCRHVVFISSLKSNNMNSLLKNSLHLKGN